MVDILRMEVDLAPMRGQSCMYEDYWTPPDYRIFSLDSSDSQTCRRLKSPLRVKYDSSSAIASCATGRSNKLCVPPLRYG